MPAEGKAAPRRTGDRPLVPHGQPTGVSRDGAWTVGSGHSSPITSVDMSPDERLVVSSGYDGRVLLWDGQGPPRQLLQADHLVNLVRFDPTARFVAAAAADCKAYVVDVADGTVVAEAGPFRDDLNAAVWRPGSEHQLVIVADTFDPVVHLWDLARGTEVASFAGHRDGVCGAAFDPSGQRLATAAEDGTARVWDVEAGACLAVLDHPNDPESVDWSPDGRFIATGCNDGRLRVYDAHRLELLSVSDVADAAVRFVRFSADSRTVLAGSYDAHLRLVSVPSCEVVETVATPWQWERSACLGTTRLLVGSFGSRPVEYEATGGRLVEPGGRTVGINTVCAGGGPAGARWFAGRDDGGVVDVTAGLVLHRHESIVNAVALSPSGHLLASCDYRGHVRLFDVRRGQVVASRRLGGTGPLNTLVWAGGDRVVCSGYSGELVWWSPASDGLRRVPGHRGPVKSLAVDRATGLVVAGSSDHTVSVWDGTTEVASGGDEGLSLVNGVAPAAAGETFASCSRDGLVRVWDLRTCTVLERLPRVHRRSVKSIVAFDGGTRMATGSYDGQVVLWERDGDQWRWRSCRLHGLPGVSAVAWDGASVVTAGWDGSVAAWGAGGSLVRHVGADVLADAPSARRTP